MQKPNLYRNPLVAGVVLALGATAMSSAVAQDDEVIDEFIATGIRGSLI